MFTQSPRRGDSKLPLRSAEHSSSLLFWGVLAILVCGVLYQWRTLSTLRDRSAELTDQIASNLRTISQLQSSGQSARMRLSSASAQRNPAHPQTSNSHVSSPSIAEKASYLASRYLRWTPADRWANSSVGTREGRGVIYVLALHGAMIESYVKRWDGRGPYLRELLRSVNSLKAVSPNTRVSLITDEDSLDPSVAALFEHVIVHHPEVKVGWGHKIPGLLQTPYRQTLYLDTDTVVCSDLEPVFAHLDHMQVGSVVEPGLFTEHLQPGLTTKRKFWFMPWVLSHQVNSGMLLYRDDPVVFNMFWAWHVDFSRKNGVWGGKPQTDQAFLAHVLDATKSVKYGYLPAEYNMRVHANTIPHFLKRGVFMLHSRYAECSQTAPPFTPRLWNFRTNGTVLSWAYATSDVSAAGSDTPDTVLSHCSCDYPVHVSRPRRIVKPQCPLVSEVVVPLHTLSTFAH